MADLRAWRLSREADLLLPSGLTVHVRRVSLVDVAAGGMIPAPLAETVQRLIKSGVDTSQGVEFSQLVELGPVLDVIARAAIISPPLADIGCAGDDEHLAPSELSFEDRAEIFRWTNAPARSLEPFRPESGGAVAAALPG